MKKQKKQRDRAPLLTRLFDHKMWAWDFVRITGFIPILCWFRLKRIFVTSTGRRKRGMLRGKYLVASNHMSFIDPGIMLCAFWGRRLNFVATDDLFKSKQGGFFKWLGLIPVNKQNVSVETFKRVQETLYRGHIVGVFPEGSVHGEGVKTFKSGIVMMAVMSGADIVPMYISKRTNAWHRQVVLIGEKIILKEHVSSEFPTMEEIENLTQLLIERELQLEQIDRERQANKKGKRK